MNFLAIGLWTKTRQYAHVLLNGSVDVNSTGFTQCWKDVCMNSLGIHGEILILVQVQCQCQCGVSQLLQCAFDRINFLGKRGNQSLHILALHITLKIGKELDILLLKN